MIYGILTQITEDLNAVTTEFKLILTFLFPLNDSQQKHQN